MERIEIEVALENAHEQVMRMDQSETCWDLRDQVLALIKIAQSQQATIDELVTRLPPRI